MKNIFTNHTYSTRAIILSLWLLVAGGLWQGIDYLPFQARDNMVLFLAFGLILGGLFDSWKESLVGAIAIGFTGLIINLGLVITLASVLVFSLVFGLTCFTKKHWWAQPSVHSKTQEG